MEDSIQHLFFGCKYSKKVWNGVKQFLLFKGLPFNLHEIVLKLAAYPYRNKIWDIINRLTIAATVYIIWQERNCRFFKGRRRNELELIQCIVEGIRLKLSTFKVKKSAAMAMALRNWKMDLIGNCLVYKNVDLGI
ncbi:uncharacterized protein [Rutidosis leptorrhynchoides]|uniref:uncharacterized protein n=1 Tax=Rutidosis leptorrhynchoides TaxID=125765 RepID=UPI003A98D6D5